MIRKRIAAVGLALAVSLGTAMADEVKVGFAGGITGPIASLAPPILQAAQMAIDEYNAAVGDEGLKIAVVTGDSQCNPQAAVDTVTKMVNVDQVAAVFGPMCSGATIAAANSVTIPNNVAILSATATAPEVTNLDDRDLVFRVAPSDDYQGKISAEYVYNTMGKRKVAVTYVNNDYGKGLNKAFLARFAELGGEITGTSAHEDKKQTYRSDLATLAKGGADTLVIFAYGEGSGLTILRESLENGLFKAFVGGDGMKSDKVISELGADNLKTFTVTHPFTDKAENSWDAFEKAFIARKGDPNSTFVGQGYDAGMILALAIAKAGGGDRAAVAKAIRDVATEPGEIVRPGEIKKALQLIKNGKAIDYSGATGFHDFDKNGDVGGTYAVNVVKDDKYVQTAILK